MTPSAQKLEALLGLAGEAVSRRELQQLIGISASELEAATDEIQTALTGHGLKLVYTAHDIELTTSPDVADFLAQYAEPTAQEELTPAAVETLAIVAYSGPVSRSEVDMIRGVDSRRMLRALRERGLIKRQSERGRSPRYEISEEFLKHVGITAREHLPRYQELSKQT